MAYFFNNCSSGRTAKKHTGFSFSRENIGMHYMILNEQFWIFEQTEKCLKFFSPNLLHYASIKWPVREVFLKFFLNACRYFEITCLQKPHRVRNVNHLEKAAEVDLQHSFLLQPNQAICECLRRRVSNGLNVALTKPILK